MFEYGDLFEKLLLNVLGHPWSVAGSGDTPSREIEELDIPLYAGAGAGGLAGMPSRRQASLSARAGCVERYV